MDHFTQSQWPTWGYAGADPFSSYSQLPTYPSYLADSIEAAYQSSQEHLLHNHQMSRATESKPRLSKEEVELLEAEFQKNHKPNSSTKKALAESMRVDNARINNWFQNRRAREKKENNIRAYEARQRMDKEKADAVTGDAPSRHRDLVASSAPFPDPSKARRPSSATSEASDNNTPNDDEIRPSTEGDLSSDMSPAASGSDLMSELAASDAASRSSVTDQIQIKTEQTNDFTTFSDSASDAQTPDLSLQPFGNHVPEYLFNSTYSLMGLEDSTKMGAAFGLQFQTYTDDMAQTGSTNSAIQESVSPELSIKSPPAIDIAGRRNRRPPPLSIGGARSHNSHAPKTAADLTAKRTDFGGSMRRVASASGPMRIVKPSSIAASQRSPYPTDRIANGLLHLNRSPVLAGPHSAMAPPTPSTPLASTQRTSDEPRASWFMDGKIVNGELGVYDQTLRTPPTTPGIMDQLFSLNSAYDFSLSDEPLATPGLARFPGEFEMPNLPSSVPGYLAQGCTSQPVTPLYTSHVGATYFGLPGGGNGEYNWSDTSLSGRSSPEHSAAQARFMNITASHFSYAEEQS
jgi:hypothetical protein